MKIYLLLPFYKNQLKYRKKNHTYMISLSLSMSTFAFLMDKQYKKANLKERV